MLFWCVCVCVCVLQVTFKLAASLQLAFALRAHAPELCKAQDC